MTQKARERPNALRDPLSGDQALPSFTCHRRNQETYVTQVRDDRGNWEGGDLFTAVKVSLSELAQVLRRVRLLIRNINSEGENPFPVFLPEPLITNQDIVTKDDVPRPVSRDPQIPAAPVNHKVVSQCEGIPG